MLLMNELTDDDLNILPMETEKEWCRGLFKMVKMNGFFCKFPTPGWTQPDTGIPTPNGNTVSVYIFLQRLNGAIPYYLGLHFAKSTQMQVFVTIGSVKQDIEAVSVYPEWRPLETSTFNAVITVIRELDISQEKKYQEMLERIERNLNNPSGQLTPEMRLKIMEIIKERKKSS